MFATREGVPPARNFGVRMKKDREEENRKGENTKVSKGQKSDENERGRERGMRKGESPMEMMSLTMRFFKRKVPF